MATLTERIRRGLGAIVAAPSMVPPPAPVPTPPAPPVRVDSTISPTPASTGGSARSSSSISNAMSGLGLASDMATQARPNINRLRLSLDELVAAYRDGLYGRTVDVLPDHATMKGWQLDGEGSDAVTIRMRELGVKKAIRDCDRWGQCLGEARLLIVTDDPMPLHLPLIPRTVRRVQALHVLDARDFSPRTWCTDVTSPLWGQPETYYVHPSRMGGATGQVVHASRLVRFYGNDLPPSAGIQNEVYPGGADAIGQRIWDGIRNLAQTAGAGERLALELSVAVFQIGSLMQKMGGDGRESFTSAVRLMSWTKSVANAILIGPGDSYQRVSANPSGFKDLSENAQRYYAALVGRPLVLLFGQSPGGLNADGDSWVVHWRSTVAQHQEARYRPPLERFVELLYWETMGEVPDYTLTFNPLGELTPIEEAQKRLVDAQIDDLRLMQQTLSHEEVRNARFGPGGYQEPTAMEEEGEEDLEARVAALLEAGEAGAEALAEGS